MPLRALVAAALALFIVIPATHAQEQSATVSFAIIIDGPWQDNDTIRVMFESEIRGILEPDFVVEFPRDHDTVADWTREGVARAIDLAYADPDIDFVITLGVIGSHEAATRGPLPKPTIAPTVIDAGLQKLPNDQGTSGVHNLNYLAYPHSVRLDLEQFLDIVEFENLVILNSAYVAAAIPGVRGEVIALATSLGLTTTFVEVEDSVEDVFANFPADAQAAYLAPLMNLSNAQFAALADSLIVRDLPSFSLFGRRDVELGVLASVNADAFPRLSRRVAINVQRILLGEDAGALPTHFEAEEQLVVNMATARAIKVYPNWAILTEAELINTERNVVARSYTLQSAVKEALIVNADVAAFRAEVEAGAKSVNVARAPLLPQINLGLLGRRIDENRAERGLGQSPQRQVSGSATLSQVIYADRAWAGYTVEKDLQRSRIAELRAVRLDVAQEAGTAYLDLLRAKTNEDIQKENLERTRQNLSLARIRESIGSGTANEIYRWESQLADNRIEVINANAIRNLVEIDFNRILYRPSEETFATQETGLNDSTLFLYRGELIKYMDNPFEFKILRSFLTRYGLGVSPELHALDEAIAAQQRLYTSAGRSFWIPDFGLQAEGDYIFWRDGIGSEPVPGFGVLGEQFDFTWSVGVLAEYPLFLGGGKFAERGEAGQTLLALRLQRDATALFIEQRVRSASHLSGAAFATILQANISTDAAHKSLLLVEDSYAQGAVDIVTLLDAQNNALIAELKAATSVYDFMINLMELERAIGKIAFEMSPEESALFRQRLDTFFANAQ